MLRSLFLALLALTITALAFSGQGPPGPRTQSALALAPMLSVNKCIQTSPGDTLRVAISVSGVSNLMAWDIYYAYDPKILEVVGRNVHRFLDKEPNSSVFDFSDPVPNTTGLYRVGAADTGGPGTEEDGGGVLAVLTLRALHEGISYSALIREDANDDGRYDYGPTLTGTGGEHVGDTDGDGIFDGAVRGGQIAVDRPCREPPPTPYVDPDLIPVQAAVNTPVASTETATGQPDDTPPEAGTSGSDGAATPAPTSEDGGPMDTGDAERRSTTLLGSQAGGGGDSGGGLSPLLASVIGAGGGAGIIASYLFFRAVRRPA